MRGPASVLNGLAGALMSDGRPSTVVDLLSRPANRENLSGDTQVLLAKASLEIGQWSAVEATLSDRSGESGPTLFVPTPGWVSSMLRSTGNTS